MKCGICGIETYRVKTGSHAGFLTMDSRRLAEHRKQEHPREVAAAQAKREAKRKAQIEKAWDREDLIAALRKAYLGLDAMLTTPMRGLEADAAIGIAKEGRTAAKGALANAAHSLVARDS